MQWLIGGSGERIYIPRALSFVKSSSLCSRCLGLTLRQNLRGRIVRVIGEPPPPSKRRVGARTLITGRPGGGLREQIRGCSQPEDMLMTQIMIRPLHDHCSVQ
ncbi:MAG: hypothetical protein IPM82_26935 [Saprospiraceae bacterium]|nr:hypothetical protein [Saprospiraceae bacterium]